MLEKVALVLVLFLVVFVLYKSVRAYPEPVKAERQKQINQNIFAMA
jgi:hypothetical protein